MANLKDLTVIFATTDVAATPAQVSHLLTCAGDGILLDWYTMDMVELALIAKHRIMPIPTLLILQNQKVVSRVVGTLPSAEGLAKLIEGL